MDNLLNFELQMAETLAKQAGKTVIQIQKGEKRAKNKADGTPVTIADLKANEIILRGLKKYFPGDGIVSEELEKVDGVRTWYIDPIDGTRDFIAGRDDFAIHIGLCLGIRPVLGVVYRPMPGLMYSAVKGHGAYLKSNGVTARLKISSTKNRPLTAVINHQERLNFKTYGKLGIKTFVECGSMGLNLMQIAENKADVRIYEPSFRVSTWDLCAPQVILEEAGGIVKFIDGAAIHYVGQEKLGKGHIAASSDTMMSCILNFIEQNNGAHFRLENSIF